MVVCEFERYGRCEIAIVFIKEALNKKKNERPSAAEALHNIWFVDFSFIPMEL